MLSFTLLLVAINWLCGVYLGRATRADRHELPNYSKHPDYAREVFEDYGRVQHEYEPFVGWKMKAYQGKTLHVSDQGLRVTPAPTFSGERTATVRFFGGSTMWGEGADDSNTIPALFNSENPEYRVFNHAQLAYNSRQELDALISMYSRGEQADIVIFYDGVNDAAFLCPNDIDELPAHRLVPMYRNQLYRGSAAMVREILSKALFRNILTVVRRTIGHPSEAPSPYDCANNPMKADQIAEMMLKNWELAHEIVTARNGKFIAILQPAAFIGKPRTDHLDLDEQLGKNFQEIYERVRRKISERNHPWIVDMSNRFDGTEHIFIDFCHVSPNGNRIIATEISNLVKNLETQHVAVSYLHP